MRNTIHLYGDFEVGYGFAPSRYSIDATDNDEFVNLFVYSPLQTEAGAAIGAQESSAVRPIHPILVGSFQPQHAAFAWPTGVLHAKEKISLSAPVYPGESLEARIRVKDKYLKNEKKFVVLEITVHKLENSTDAMVIERTLVWPH